MARKRKTKVFISYSRHDEALVRPLAKLLGTAADDSVFMDVESLKPGDLWEQETMEALRQSLVFVLCWCCKTKSSSFVAKEIEIALTDPQKKVVPVLFCPAELPGNLSRRLWIDLRERVLHSCDEQHKQKPDPVVLWHSRFFELVTEGPQSEAEWLADQVDSYFSCLRHIVSADGSAAPIH